MAGTNHGLHAWCGLDGVLVHKHSSLFNDNENQCFEPFATEVEEYLVKAFEMLKRDEEEQLEFFHDISSWREKYIMLQVRR